MDGQPNDILCFPLHDHYHTTAAMAVPVTAKSDCYMCVEHVRKDVYMFKKTLCMGEHNTVNPISISVFP